MMLVSGHAPFSEIDDIFALQFATHHFINDISALNFRIKLGCYRFHAISSCFIYNMISILSKNLVAKES